MCTIKKASEKTLQSFTGNVCVELFLDKAAGWRTEFLSKNDSGMGVFWKFVEISKNNFYKNNFRQLLLNLTLRVSLNTEF